jgi:hypothetical protein
MASAGGGSDAEARPPTPNRQGTFLVPPPQAGQAGSGARSDWMTSKLCPSPHRSW